MDDEEYGMSFQKEGAAETADDIRLCLVGRFLADKPIRSNVKKERMASIWRPVMGIFLFQFHHHRHIEGVMKGGPWTFDSHILILGRMQMGISIHNIPLNHVEFWV